MQIIRKLSVVLTLILILLMPSFVFAEPPDENPQPHPVDINEPLPEPGLLTAGSYTYYRPYRGSHPVTSTTHPGYYAIDWGMPNNTKLYSPFPKGVVTFCGWTYDGYGNNIRIVDHEQGLMSLYGHLRNSNPCAVKAGDTVYWNTVVAYSDNTGNSTGPHLHMEIRKKPYTGGSTFIFWNAFDPFPSNDPTPTPKPNPQPTPVPGQGIRAIVVKPKGQLSIYSCAKKTCSVVGHVPKGTVLYVLDVPNTNWVKIVQGTYTNRYTMEKNKAKVLLRAY